MPAGQRTLMPGKRWAQTGPIFSLCIFFGLPENGAFHPDAPNFGIEK
jgi:hypothetical protein